MLANSFCAFKSLASWGFFAYLANMATVNKDKLNESFYSLLKDILETQGEIIKRIETVEKKIGPAGGGSSAAMRWKGM